MSDTKDKTEPAKVDAPKRDVRLDPQRFDLLELRRNSWAVDAAEGTSIQDVLKSEYWSLISPRLRPYDRLQVVVESGEWMADLVVLQVANTWAKVHLLHFHELEKADVISGSTAYKVEWKGPHLKWCAIRLADAAKVSEKHESAATAHEWLRNFERTVTAT